MVARKLALVLTCLSFAGHASPLIDESPEIHQKSKQVHNALPVSQSGTEALAMLLGAVDPAVAWQLNVPGHAAREPMLRSRSGLPVMARAKPKRDGLRTGFEAKGRDPAIEIAKLENELKQLKAAQERKKNKRLTKDEQVEEDLLRMQELVSQLPEEDTILLDGSYGTGLNRRYRYTNYNGQRVPRELLEGDYKRAQQVTIRDDILGFAKLFSFVWVYYELAQIPTGNDIMTFGKQDVPGETPEQIKARFEAVGYGKSSYKFPELDKEGKGSMTGN